MSDKINKYVHDNFKAYFPFIERDVVECKQFGPFDLLVKLNDGTAYSYSDLERSIRKIPVNGNEMTEKECRKEFGYRLAQRLRLKGMTYNDLSEKTGISVNTICKYISGSMSPTFYKVDRIARALDCTTDYFMFD